METLEFHKIKSDHTDEWYWHLREQGEGTLVAIGGQAFRTEEEVDQAIQEVEDAFRRKALSKDEFFILRKEHWNELTRRLQTRAQSSPLTEMVEEWINEAESAEVGYDHE